MLVLNLFQCDVKENSSRHAELVHRSLGVGGLVEAYPSTCSKLPFDIGSQKHSPAQGDAQPRHAEPVEAYPIPCSKIPFDIGSQKHSPAQDDAQPRHPMSYLIFSQQTKLTYTCTNVNVYYACYN